MIIDVYLFSNENNPILKTLIEPNVNSLFLLPYPVLDESNPILSNLIFSKVAELNPTADKIVILQDKVIPPPFVTGSEIISSFDSEDFDLFYLSRWLDKSSSYKTINEFSNGSKLIRTFSPSGFTYGTVIVNSVFYELKDKMDNKRSIETSVRNLIESGNYKCLSTTPVLLSFSSDKVVDLTYAGEYTNNHFSYLKTCEVVSNDINEIPIKRRISNDLSLFWLVVIILSIFAGGYSFGIFKKKKFSI